MAETNPDNIKLHSQSYCDALNILTLEYLDDGTFQLSGSIPKDFLLVYPEIRTKTDGLRPDEFFPFVEHFLEEAREAWNQGKRIKSGPWMESCADGKEVALEASAIMWNKKRILLLELLGDAYDANRNILQLGRENVLIKQYLEEEVRKRTQVIRDREEEIALRLVWAAEAKDGGETGTHIRRIGLFSAEMAKALDWSIDEIDDIRIAATMHDVGKIAIPDKILRKPGELDEEEFEIMKTHTLMGGRILDGSKATMLHMARDIALYHHEKWDGSGYPHGIAGEEIPVCARIVSLVDVYDALVSKRVYKEAWSEENTIEAMKKERGKKFDPELFDIFERLRDIFQEIATAEYPPLFEGFADDYNL